MPSPQPEDEQWEQVYIAAERVLATSWGRDVLRETYVGVYVDEYQDCSLNQHQLVLRLAEHLPCRVLGDPLQGIFGFRKEESVDWDRHVIPVFEALPQLTEPWRWRQKNVALGEWLMSIREPLRHGQPIDLAGAPVTHVRRSDKIDESETATAFAALQHKDESIVVIRPEARECHRLASRLRGRFTSMEEIVCRDLMSASRVIDGSTGAVRAAACIEFAKNCMTGIAAVSASLMQTLGAGRTPRVGAGCPRPELYARAAAVCTDASWATVRALFGACKALPGTILYRHELWDEMSRAVRIAEEGETETLHDAAWKARNITRQTGRRERAHSVSRTLLIKGLEYDHVIVTDIERMDARNIYVALSRASASLTVVSDDTVIVPAVATRRKVARRSGANQPSDTQNVPTLRE